MNRKSNAKKSKSRIKLDQQHQEFLRLGFLEDRAEQPPKPVIANTGDKGKKLQQAVAELRQRLQAQRWQMQKNYEAQAASQPQRTRPITVRSVKDTIIERILAEKTSTLNRRQLNRLALGELHPQLPRFDWRDLVVVPPVRNQRKCNSCWAIAATQAFEANLMIQLANFEANLMIQLSNFATNNNVQLPDTFFISQVALNVHSTMDRVEPFSCDVGRFESAFNFYFDHGLPTNEITLNTVPLDQQGKVQPVPFDQVKRDARLPKGQRHGNTSARLKIIGWDYVRRDAFKLPTEKALKQALLEHGPLVVAMNTVGLQDFSTTHLIDHSDELATNPGSGVMFRQERVSGGLLVCVPTNQMEKKFVESLHMESFNLNDPIGGDQRYRFFPAANDTFKQGEHLRAAHADLDVGVFRERNANDFYSNGKAFHRKTDTFIFHFPRGNDVRLKQDPLTDRYAVHLPANSEIKLEPDPNTSKLTLINPWHPPEDLDPVFDANPAFNFNHFVLLIGWDDRKQAWIVQNSWGDDWGFACGSFGGIGEGKGCVYIRYGTFGQFAAWLEAELLDQKLLASGTHTQPPKTS